MEQDEIQTLVYRLYNKLHTHRSETRTTSRKGGESTLKEYEAMNKTEAIKHTLAILESVRIINEITQDPEKLDEHIARIMQTLKDGDTKKDATEASQSTP